MNQRLTEGPIVLLGLKHSGKSSVARGLAPFLGARAVDLDEAVALAARQRYPEIDDPPGESPAQTVRRLYKEKGASAFKDLETEETLKAMEEARQRPLIIATGGGTIDNPAAVEALRKQSLTVFLEVPETILFSRIMRGGLPAFLDPERPEEHFHEIFEARTGKCLELAHLVVTLDKQNIETVVAMVLKKIKEYTHAR